MFPPAEGQKLSVSCKNSDAVPEMEERLRTNQHSSRNVQRFGTCVLMMADQHASDSLLKHSKQDT